MGKEKVFAVYTEEEGEGNFADGRRYLVIAESIKGAVDKMSNRLKDGEYIHSISLDLTGEVIV